MLRRGEGARQPRLPASLRGSSSLPPCLLDHLRYPFELLIRNRRFSLFQERGNDQFDRSAEESVDDVGDCDLRHLFARDHRLVDVAGAITLELYVALFLEDAQVRAHGSVSRRIGNGIPDLGRRGSAQFIERIHYLALSSAQPIPFTICHMCQYFDTHYEICQEKGAVFLAQSEKRAYRARFSTVFANSANRRSRSVLSRTFPPWMTASIFETFLMSFSGSALRITMSATFPDEIEPSRSKTFMYFAGLLVAQIRACIGVRPALTRRASSSCTPHPAKQCGFPPMSLPVSIGTPAFTRSATIRIRMP